MCIFEVREFYTDLTYNYQLVYDLASYTSQSVLFQIQNRNDAHILLKAGARDFEIVIGGWGNTKSVIRDRMQGPPLSSFQGIVCDENNFKKFMISWSFNVIRVYKYEDGNDDLNIEEGGVEIMKLDNYTGGCTLNPALSGFWKSQN